ncbi:hypothetical protein PENFLA_c009G00094 [Penicillium flavigenum]|uniref:NB-ARC domain-containing protein n=1 Tax=Penicillium flavigenum TaxID=254877 RepID=A0A1V6TGH6_9EURO|nr:hypothetical protein PENFLA_c009G00094 [Penicillium flavigenum]
MSTFATELREFECAARESELRNFSLSYLKSIPFAPNKGFGGRERELTQLEELLFPKESEADRVAISGLDGVGKTRLAMQIVHRTEKAQPESSIFWIPAKDTETLERKYTQIVRKLKLPGSEDPEADAKKLLQNHLCGDAGQWLLVYDNADDEAMWFGETTRLKDYVPYNKAGSVLFTTRFEQIALKLAMPDHVVKLPTEDKVMAR